MVNYCDKNVRDFCVSNSHSETTFEVFYQNVRGLRTKRTGVFDNVCSMDFQIICLTETRLNGMCFDHMLFLDAFPIFHSDRVSGNKYRGGSVLLGVSSRVRGCKRIYDLQFYDQCVWWKFTP
jgi:hypothetical protein